MLLYTYVQVRNISCESVVHHAALFLLSLEGGVWHRHFQWAVYTSRSSSGRS